MEREVIALTANGERHEITKRRSTIGRSPDCQMGYTRYARDTVPV